jgi:hypothetical protein
VIESIINTSTNHVFAIISSRFIAWHLAIIFQKNRGKNHVFASDRGTALNIKDNLFIKAEDDLRL